MTKTGKIWRRKGKIVPEFQELVTTFPVFSNFKLTVVFSKDIIQSALYIADRDFTQEPQMVDTAEAFTVSSVRGGYANIYLNPEASAGTIAHEAYHAICAMLKMAGAAEEHEVVAYHLGYVTDLIMAFQLKVKSRFKKKGKKK